MSDSTGGRTGSLPRVGLPACIKTIGKDVFHVAGRKYLTAVSRGAGCWPIVLPSLGDWYRDVMDWPEALFGLVDGILLTGSPSNLEPHHYGMPVDEADEGPRDPRRDTMVLSFLRVAVERGVPILALCRGMQELNVAFGGSLHQRVHDLRGRLDHRADSDQPMEVQYGYAHEVNLTAGGQLQSLAGGREHVQVNSVHGQGIDRVAARLEIEAMAPDGTVEALRVRDAPAFALAVQWHPEWRFWDDTLSTELFRTFGDAVRERAGAAHRERGV